MDESDSDENIPAVAAGVKEQAEELKEKYVTIDNYLDCGCKCRGLICLALGSLCFSPFCFMLFSELAEISACYIMQKKKQKEAAKFYLAINKNFSTHLFKMYKCRHEK